MPALPADIAAGTRDATILDWSNAAVKARYPSARDTLASPSEGFFDSAANAQTAINQRGALVGVERRRFTAPAQDLLWVDPETGMPTFKLIDAEQGVNAAMLIGRIELDLDAEVTTGELFG